ncbi:MAG: tetratricopeptide repeat protein, partial [Cytophagaceae bacterium]|nr:tetratricopeptide repeat protein [Gemmatimonadaceae bacterium]
MLAVPNAVAQGPSLGRITFPTSGRTEAQPLFIRGVLYLHSFEYDSAARAFREAQRLDPTHAMAYWGEAMTYTHPVWHEQDATAARESLKRLAPSAQARRAMAPTAREKRWLDAIEVLYGEGSKERRDTLYAREMERFARDFPGDHEVSAFHALSLLGLPTRGRDLPTYMRAATIAEEVYRENPEHPGALHYLIHAYDDPVHAPLGLRAARAYGAVAPAAAHAQHMTSHIFVAMGLWNDVERANLAAWGASNQRNGHYTHWLSYGYLQKGRVKESRSFVDAIIKDAAADPTPYKLAYMNIMLAGFLVDADGATASLVAHAADSARRVGGRGEFRREASAL